MDGFEWIIALWILFSLLGNLAKKKLPPPQMPPDINSENQPGTDFEIPTLANDPNFPGEEPTILINDTTPQAEIREMDLEEIYRRTKIRDRENFRSVQKIETPEKIESSKLPDIVFGLNPESSKEALILAEIFGKPKALRQR